VSYGGIPIGSLLGGLLTDHLGGRGALVVIAVGLLLTPLWVLLSPIRSLRELPSGRADGLGAVPPPPRS